MTTFRRVPRGTNGAVSAIGVLFSFLGGLTIGIAHYLTIRCISSESVLFNSPDQWPIIVCGGFAGLFGSLVDSVLGATIQYSGMDGKGRISDNPTYGYKRISGFRLVDNHTVNLLANIITAIVMPPLAVKYWPY